MFFYHLKLAWRSVIATPWLSVVTVIGIALGIAVPTTLISIRHVFATDPIPDKSDRLFNVRVENWETGSEFFDIKPGDPPKHITYRDMTGLMASDLPVGETGIASATAFIFPDRSDQRPFQTTIRLCHADFFQMFEVPLRYGAGWTAAQDRDRAAVVVLSQKLNDRLFGGADSVGETLRIGTRDFTVVGVLERFRPIPQYYDVINNAMGEPRDLFIPFDDVLDESLGLNQTGDTDGWGSFDFDSLEALARNGEYNWIQYWVELPRGGVDAYRDWVDAYALEQKALGRFPRPLNNRVTPLMEWMRVRDVVPMEVNGLIVIAVLFLVVCCLNLLGLLLAKFLSRSGILGVHRALGASRGAIFMQRLIECELVGIAGGIVGLSLDAGAMRGINRSIPATIMSGDILRIDGYGLGVALALALVAGLVSGLYPAWRACRVAPAIQLKLN
jgi:putative ABC transport system permease protein